MWIRERLSCLPVRVRKEVGSRQGDAGSQRYGQHIRLVLIWDRPSVFPAFDRGIRLPGQAREGGEVPEAGHNLINIAHVAQFQLILASIQAHFALRLFLPIMGGTKKRDIASLAEFFDLM